MGVYRMKKKLLILAILIISLFNFQNVNALSINQNINYSIPRDLNVVKVENQSKDIPQIDKDGINNEKFNFCERKGILQVLRIGGTALNIIKILVPVLLIITATIEVSRAFMSGDDNDIKKAGTSSLKKAIAAIIIFFIPSIVEAVLNLIPAKSNPSKYYNSQGTGTYSQCLKCFFNPSVSYCEASASKS